MNKDELRKEWLAILDEAIETHREDTAYMTDEDRIFENLKDVSFEWFLSKLTQRDSEWVEAIEGMKTYTNFHSHPQIVYISKADLLTKMGVK